MSRALNLLKKLSEEMDGEFVSSEPFDSTDDKEQEYCDSCDSVVCVCDDGEMEDEEGEDEVSEPSEPKEDEKIPVQEFETTDPAVESEIDSDDEHLLAVLDLYFGRLSKKPMAVKADKLQALVNRLINVMINMPQGEKQARAALKVAIKTMNESSSKKKVNELNDAERKKLHTQARKERQNEASGYNKGQINHLLNAGNDIEDICDMTIELTSWLVKNIEDYDGNDQYKRESHEVIVSAEDLQKSVISFKKVIMG